MAKNNQSLATRSDFRLPGLDTGGLLNPEQSNRFIDLIVEQPTLLNRIRVEKMNAPVKNINRLGFDARVLKAARQDPNSDQEGLSGDRRLTQAERSKPVTSQIQLASKEVIAEVRLPYEVLEDNIEGQSMSAHVMRQLAERVALDLEELALNGDTGSGDTYLALTDGFLKTISSNVVDNLNAGLTPDVLAQGMLAMPQKYLRNLSALKHYVSVANTIKYRQNVAARATGYGDSALTGNGMLMAHGIEVVPANSLAYAGETAFGAADGPSNESGIFTFPKNLIMGIQRDISIETDKDITAREHIIVVTARIDFQVDDEAAAVKYLNIG